MGGWAQGLYEKGGRMKDQVIFLLDVLLMWSCLDSFGDFTFLDRNCYPCTDYYLQEPLILYGAGKSLKKPRKKHSEGEQ